MFIVPVSRDSRVFSNAARFFAASDSTPRTPALDIAESNAAYTVKLDVPGVAKEDVKVTVEGRRVTVQAQHEVGTAQNEQPGASARAGDRIVYRERLATSYSRSFTLPVEVDNEQSQAKLDNGVLTLTLPKRNARVAARVPVN